MTVLVFVDTNVFLYARDASEGAKQRRAAAWLEHLWRQQLGRTSMQVLSEYYVNVTRKLVPGLSHVEAWDDVSALFAWRPQPTDEAIMRLGREVGLRHRLSWWDSLIVAAAQAQGCALLLSEDFRERGTYAGMTVRSPFTFAVDEHVGEYATHSLPPVPYRSPGRPRRVPTKS